MKTQTGGTKEQVPFGPGSIFIPTVFGAVNTNEFDAADVALTIEDHDGPGDTIALLQLDALPGDRSGSAISIVIELTAGDVRTVIDTLTEVADANKQADGWRVEHELTEGEHFDLKGPGTSAYGLCPVCIEARA